MDKNAEFKEITINGIYYANNKVFKFTSVVKPEDLENSRRVRPQKHSVVKRFVSDLKDSIGYYVNRTIKDVQMKIYNYKEGEKVRFFCDLEGKIYFFTDNGVQCFISADETMALTEFGEYYKIIKEEDGFTLDPIDPLSEAFPYKFVHAEEETFDFEGDFSGMEEIKEDDPFAPNSAPKSNIIDLEVARFLRERDGRGR